MKIIFIHQYFRTPDEGGGIRSYHMAKCLVAAGHEVEMITSHNSKNYELKLVEGFKVHYLPVYYDNKLGFTGRSYAFLKFTFLAYLKVLRIKNTDLIYASSSPLTIGAIALILKKIHRIHYIFEVMDLWPEAPIQMGFIKNPFFKRFLYWLEKKIYKNAVKIIAASPGMAQGVLDKAPGKDVIMIPNIADCEYFVPTPKDPSIERAYGTEGKFVICYIGALGLANAPHLIVELARNVQEKSLLSVHFIVAGEGAKLAELKKTAIAYKLENIVFTGFLNKTRIKEILNISDANLVTFSDKPILETNSPNKFFDGLAAGKATITNTKGWIKDLCEENVCGFFAGKHLELCIQQIQVLISDPALLLEYKANARRLALEKFEGKLLMAQFAETIRQTEILLSK